MKGLNKSLLIAALPWLMLAGCDSSESDPDDKYVVLNMVTYEGTSQAGVTTLTFREIDDSPLITLTCDWTPDPAIDGGTRLMALYTTDTPQQSAHVALRQAARTFGGALKQTSRPDTLTLRPVYMNSLWRSGGYLNLDALMQYSSTQRSVSLVLDEATASSPCPVLYLETSAVLDSTAVFGSRVYASWDASQLWQQQSVDSLKVRLLDANRHVNEVTFKKQK